MRLIDADALRARMYNDAFEVDSDMQKWESGCWIRYKMFENAINDAPSIDLVRCAECKRVREDGGHANCNGYLYCRKWKTLVDEDCYCSWGEREDE